jgi:Ion transport protein
LLLLLIVISSASAFVVADRSYTSHTISYAGTTDPCIEQAPESIEIITSVFRYKSLAVSCFFALEMLTKVAVFGWRYFCDPWQMLDAVVVAAGLVTNIVLIGGSSGLMSIVVITAYAVWTRRS